MGIPPAHNKLAEIMAALAAGDPAAIAALYVSYGDRIRGAVRAHARTFNVTLRADEVEGLTHDVLLICADVAGSWRPDGSTPWVYARGRVRAAVSAHIGQFADSLDMDHVVRKADDECRRAERHLYAVASASPAELDDAMHRLADEHDVIGLLLDAFDAAQVSERDRRLLIAHRDEIERGNLSPAVTLSIEFNMTEPAARQAVSRCRRRLVRVVQSDDRFEALRSAAVLAA